MTRKAWLSAAVAIGLSMATTGCESECVDELDCQNEGEGYICVEGLCEPPPAPPPTDAGTDEDAGQDAGETEDGGMDAGTEDGGTSTCEETSCPGPFLCNDESGSVECVPLMVAVTRNSSPGAPTAVPQATLVPFNGTTSEALGTVSKWPRFSGDGTQVAFVRVGASTDLVSQSLDGGAATTLVTAVGAGTQDFVDLEYAPFTSGLVWSQVDVVSGDVDGIQLFDLMSSSASTIVPTGIAPDPSPTQTHVAFSDPTVGISTWDATDGGVSYVPETAPGAQAPYWNDTGFVILYVQSQNTPSNGFDDEIFAVLASGATPTRLADAVAPEGNATDGGTIGHYVGQPESLPGFPPVVAYTKFNYYVDSSGANALCGSGAEPTYCDPTPRSEVLLRGWSPAGPAPDATTLGAGQLPSSSPDGTHIAFIRDGALVVQQLIMGSPMGGMSYTHELNVISSDGDDSRPRWQPSGAPMGPPPGPPPP